jgi:hypothetical protein
MLAISKHNIKKNKKCQQLANNAKDVLTTPFLHIQKFSTNILILSANCLLLALLMLIKLYSQRVTILLMLISL